MASEVLVFSAQSTGMLGAQDVLCVLPLEISTVCAKPQRGLTHLMKLKLLYILSFDFCKVCQESICIEQGLFVFLC